MTPETTDEEPHVTRPVLQIIIASTRPGRVGLPVATWFTQAAVAHGAFEIDLIDLAEIDLPFLDEPHHPRLQKYTKEHTKAWSARIGRGDAYVFVTPEYNHGFNAVLKNAIDFLHNEWIDKPVGFVTYGGVAAGTRSMQMLKQVVTALKMVPLVPAVNIPFVATFLDEQRVVQPNDAMTDGASALLDELARVTPAMRSLRAVAV
jgi:NAD(P)H-dependent FMN reductase